MMSRHLRRIVDAFRRRPLAAGPIIPAAGTTTNVLRPRITPPPQRNWFRAFGFPIPATPRQAMNAASTILRPATSTTLTFTGAWEPPRRRLLFGQELEAFMMLLSRAPIRIPQRSRIVPLLDDGTAQQGQQAILARGSIVLVAPVEEFEGNLIGLFTVMYVAGGPVNVEAFMILLSRAPIGIPQRSRILPLLDDGTAQPGQQAIAPDTFPGGGLPGGGQEDSEAAGAVVAPAAESVGAGGEEDAETAGAVVTPTVASILPGGEEGDHEAARTVDTGASNALPGEGDGEATAGHERATAQPRRSLFKRLIWAAVLVCFIRALRCVLRDIAVGTFGFPPQIVDGFFDLIEFVINVVRER